MSSAGQALGAVVGAVYGFATGDFATAMKFASYGITVGGLMEHLLLVYMVVV